MDPDRMLTMAEALDLLPKVELHCHVEETMRPGTLVELAASSGHALGTTEPSELYRYDSLDGFLKLFWLAQSCLIARDDRARLAHESVVDGAAHGLVYRESFFTPARPGRVRGRLSPRPGVRVAPHRAPGARTVRRRRSGMTSKS